jgi:hypothetical protein
MLARPTHPPPPQSRRALTTLTLGLAQAIAAHSWHNTFGVVVGALAFFTGAALHALWPASTRSIKPPPPRWARRAAQALSAFVLVLLAVRMASSPDPQVHEFPTACPAGLQGKHGCSRVALENAHRAPPSPNNQPFRARALLSDVEAELLRWLGQQPRVTILRHASASSSQSAGGGFLHARVVTPLWGFADDFFVRWRCSRVGEAVVEVQGQLRLGVGDLEVNVKRNGAVLGHLREAPIPAAAWCR